MDTFRSFLYALLECRTELSTVSIGDKKIDEKTISVKIST